MSPMKAMRRDPNVARNSTNGALISKLSTKGCGRIARLFLPRGRALRFAQEDFLAIIDGMQMDVD